MDTQKESPPKIDIHWAPMDDPNFNSGSTHTATLTVTNPTTASFSYIFELYMDVTKVASSGKSSAVIIPAGGNANVPMSITMPAVAGTWHVYIDVTVAGAIMDHFQATEDIVVVVQPGITIGNITWS